MKNKLILALLAAACAFLLAGCISISKNVVPFESVEQKERASNEVVAVQITDCHFSKEKPLFDALVEKKLNCVVECNPNLGEMLMQLVKQVAAGKTIPRITYNEEKIFTEYDDFSKYEPRGY